MLSYILSFFNNFWSKEPEEDDLSKESFLADQLLDIETLKEKEENDVEVENREIPRNVACFQRSGLITYTGDNNYVLIDGNLYFDTSSSPLSFNVNDKILFLGYKDDNEAVKVVRVLENYGPFWGDSMETEEDQFKVIEHVIVGEVGYREERLVYLKGNDLKFSLDDVEANFIPMKGDWLELRSTVQYQDDKPGDISAAQVLKVLSFKPLRSKVKSAVVTSWSGDSGTCDRQFFFNRQSVQNGSMPQVGAKVMVEAIESNQGACTWRVTKMIIMESAPLQQNNNDTMKTPEEDITLNLEQERKISVTYPIVFENVDFHQSQNMTLEIANNSDQTYYFNKWIMLSKKKDSQVEIKPFINRGLKIYPGRTFTLSITCYPKFLGSTKECLILMFNGFQVKRFININVVDNSMKNLNENENDSCTGMKSEYERVNMMRDVRRNRDKNFIPGIKISRAPNFVPVRMGAFPIPDKMWSAVLGNSEQTVFSNEYNKILDRLETALPCLCQDLTISTYLDRWHTLLFMDEIQINITIRVYDMPKVYLIHCQEYLGIEIKGLCEKRPSLIKGDKVIVKDTWGGSAQYEGFIHVVKGDLILLKFNPQFHETYSGSDVSVEFHFNRSVYRRAHQAINLAISNLGPEILFPMRLVTRPQQVSPHDISNIQWFNKKLNPGQKAAVTNILQGECRPLPYCIYGPPGTGKTITVIETILQIISVIPDSRILVATPSNSAANLITERLIEYRDRFSGSIIRLLANYLVDSDTVPDIIKPFCATMDIAREETSKPNYQVRKDGVNLNCQTSFIGRHRVTIGTCYCLGTLAQMGLPRGHFTHVIVDEAGQATEPEIMIPLTFTDKENGQIVLAGDPQQLGPVILSKYCKEYSMDVSYFSRILETYPYQRDFDAYEDGFNKKLVTKLNYNYRSLEEVLKLPSEMFYDASLVPKMNRDQAWITNTINICSDVFDSTQRSTGGIFVFGIKGVNARAEDSPSWFNREEAAMVALTTCKLYKRNITPDDIGIITPYIAQTKYFKVLFESMGLPLPKVGTVEEFQGQERHVILISTVRSAENYLADDQKHSLGFVSSPKRLNVALTRAQVTIILFCNPHLLCIDPLWSKVIRQAVKEDKYKGCDLPYGFEIVNTGINN